MAHQMIQSVGNFDHLRNLPPEFLGLAKRLRTKEAKQRLAKKDGKPASGSMGMESFESGDQHSSGKRYLQMKDGTMLEVYTSDLYEVEDQSDGYDSTFELFADESEKTKRLANRKPKLDDITCGNCGNVYKGILNPKYGPYCSDDCRTLGEIARVKMEGLQIEQGTYVSPEQRRKFMTAQFLDSILRDVVETKQRRQSVFAAAPASKKTLKVSSFNDVHFPLSREPSNVSLRRCKSMDSFLDKSNEEKS